MIPNGTVIEEEGSLGGEIVEMSIDQNSLVHLMGVLTRLYEDPEMAILREYATNALDSHIAAGQTAPVEVFLPSRLAQTLTIKDRGVGLSSDDLRNLYSKYGASTKRGTNKQTGTLGVGCKVGLIQGAFSIKAVKDGRVTLASISRQASGVGAIEILSEGDTVEENGVEITIPFAPYNNLAEKAHRLFQYWRPGTVLVDGAEIPQPEGEKYGDHILVQKSRNRYDAEGDVVVMGGVPYPVPDEIGSLFPAATSSYSHFRVVCWVKMGTLTFTPSRESLELTTQTKETLQALREDIALRIAKLCQGKITPAKTKHEAVVARYALAREMGFDPGPVTWRREIVPNLSEMASPMMRGWTGKYAHTDLGRVVTYNIPQDGAKKYAMIDLDGQLMDKQQKSNLTLWANEHPGIAVLVFNRRVSDWLDLSYIPYEQIRKFAAEFRKNARAAVGKGLKIRDGLVSDPSRGGTKIDIAAAGIDTSKPIYYCSLEDHKQWHGTAKLLNNWHRRDYEDDDASDAFTFVVGNEKKIATFLKSFPAAKNIRFAVDTAKAEMEAEVIAHKQGTVAVRAKRMDYNAKRLMDTLDPARVDDPELRALIECNAAADQEKQQEVPACVDFYDRLRRYLPSLTKYGMTFLGQDEEEPETVYPFVKYDLINHTNSWALRHGAIQEHLYVYMNAIYAQTQSTTEEETA